ncbi:MAG: extracellular solute-binding protein [Clostridia bacterium]|jgi:arabinogalactan oligomer/maltooligosaccharide transport system substrate-binding protein|nr:extracellular solute-binding protein [Clostridia bacterium]MBP6161487.1 extracellular solute-binding protein [Clostridia bacterium]MBP6949788.1 extracellular solute-binding protein [Clostridia bacterium]
MKKTLPIIFALVVVLALLVGCGPPAVPDKTDPDASKDPGKDPGVGLKAAEITVQVEEGWREYYEAAVKRIKDANPDVTINLQEVGSFTHLDTLSSTDAANPDVADLFALPADRLTGLANSDLLGAVDAKAIAAKLGGWDDFDAGLGGLFKVGDEYLAFPYNIETLVTFANVKNAETEGLDLSKPVELADVADPAHALLPVFDTWFGVALTNSADIALLKEDGDAFVTDLTADWANLAPEKQAAINVLYEYWKLNREANTTLFDAEAGWGYIDEQFTTGGKGVFRIGGPWELAAMLEKTNNGDDLEIYPIGQITVAGKPMKHWQGGWGLAINPRIEEDPDKVALAEAVIAELVNPEYFVELFKATGKILENVPAETYAASNLSEVEKKLVVAVIDSFKVSPGRPLFQQFGPVWDTWKNGVLSWNAVAPASVEAAYAEIKASFDAMMVDLR